MTFPFETIKITSIDRFCKEITAVVYDTPVGARCIKICRVDDALRRVHVGDVVACSDLGEQWSTEYMERALEDYRSEKNENVPISPLLTAVIELWCFDRGIKAEDFCLGLSVFLCNRSTDVLVHELYERWHKAQIAVKETTSELKASAKV